MALACSSKIKLPLPHLGDSSAPLVYSSVNGMNAQKRSINADLFCALAFCFFVLPFSPKKWHRCSSSICWASFVANVHNARRTRQCKRFNRSRTFLLRPIRLRVFKVHAILRFFLQRNRTPRSFCPFYLLLCLLASVSQHKPSNSYLRATQSIVQKTRNKSTRGENLHFF